MREDELFGQARTGTFGGQFNFADDSADPLSTKYAYSNAFIGHIRDYSESLGRRPDDRRQKTWAWFAMDTWKASRKLTVDYGLRMYKWGPPVSMSGEASAFSFERFDPTWGGNPPVLFRPVTSGGQRRAQNPLTGEILPATYIGLIVPGTGFTCGVITPANPCTINGIVTQNDPKYSTAGKGFVNNLPVQFDPRMGVAYAMNPRTVIRLAGGSFHDGTSGPTLQQGGNPAFQFTRQIFYTDFNNYLTNSATSLVPNVGGILRNDTNRPNNVRFTAAVQREIGAKIVVDAAYVGTRTRKAGESINMNAIPSGARFLAQNRDATVAATALSPGALPDAFLRPLVGFNDIWMEQPTASSTYDSLQVQVSRRFTGRFEMAGSYTLANGKDRNPNTSNNNLIYSNNPLPAPMYRRDIQQQVLVVSYLYELPKASSVFGNSGVVRGVLDNWKISGISTFGTGGRGDIGVTYSPGADYVGGGEFCYGTNPSGAGPFDLVGSLELPSSQQNVDRWFNTDNVKPASGRGDVANGCNPWKFTLPGWKNHDISLFKDIRMKGSQLLEYRLEIYNLFNTVQFQTVNTTATFNPNTGAQTNANFGKVTAARNERRMQMSLRYTF